MDKNENLFSIGEVSRICDISISALRHYDKVGVIKPAYVDPETNYRYFNNDAISLLVMLRYYQTLGFQLEEVKEIFENNSLPDLQLCLKKQRNKLDDQIKGLIKAKDRINAWEATLDNAQMILKDVNSSESINLRYIEAADVLFCDPKIYKFTKLKHLLANPDLGANATGENQITYGPLHASFPSFHERLKENLEGVRLFANRHSLNTEYANTMKYDAYQALSAYHKGSYDNIAMTYGKIETWAEKHNFRLRGDSIECYISDFWCGKDENMYVTEVLLPLL